jgi:dihydrofolate synthase/folylpolyglutamate synthase
MALEYFANQKVDIAIIETGLGGRLDSTNVITPEVSIITNIGFDHMDILGDTLSKIAGEKAGIIKQRIPVVIGETTAETKTIFTDKAKEKDARIFFAEEQYEIIAATLANELLQVQMLHNADTQTNTYELDLTGFYQAKNLRTVLTSVDAIKNTFSLQQQNIKSALSHVKNSTGLHGRWEVIRRNPTVVLDVAHNVDGIQQVINQVKNTFYENLHIVFGMVKDKEIEKVLEILPKNALYYFTRAKIPIALSETEVLQRAQKFI